MNDISTIYKRMIALADYEMNPKLWRSYYIAADCFAGLTLKDEKMLKAMDDIFSQFKIDTSEKVNTIGPHGLIEGVSHPLLYHWMMSGISWDIYWLRCVGVIINLEIYEEGRSMSNIYQSIYLKQEMKVVSIQDEDIPF